MTSEQITELTIHLSNLSAYYRLAINDAVLKMYADDLSDMDYTEVMNALNKYRKNPKNRFMPLPAMIRELINPEIDDDTIAISTASKVLQAVSKYGWSNASEAKYFIGELGWAGVARFGGWTYVCENLGDGIQLGTFNAQLREVLKSEIKVFRSGGALPEIEYKHRDPDSQISNNRNAQVISLLKSMGKDFK